MNGLHNTTTTITTNTNISNFNSHNNINKNNNNLINCGNKFKRWSGTTTNDSAELKRELELRSLELMKKDDEIKILRDQINQLNQQYSQEVLICCSYSTSLTNLKKEVCQMKDSFILKEEQYKKQIQDLQMKLYYQYQPTVGQLRI